MASISLLVFCLGTLFGSGAFFRKGGEMLATYILFPIVLAAVIMGLKTDDTELFFGQINKSAIFGALLGAILLAAYHILQIQQAGGFSLAGIRARLGHSAWFDVRQLWQTGRTQRQPRQSARNASTIYYQTAIKLGALTTRIDKTRAADGFATIKATFNLNRATCPEALDVFNAQIRKPQKLRAILKPFINQYGDQSTIAETLIYGMCKVALADGEVSLVEISLIDQTASLLGLSTIDTRRIIASAGIGIEDEFRHEQKSWQDQFQRGANQGAGPRASGHGSWQRQSQPLSPRAGHLATLGLPADAALPDAKKAWRKLAAKYHPDKLVSQNLPAEEMEKAEDMMQAINEAYDWLKENAR